MTAADKYYLKARENYPYEMEIVLDALEYGLSYDEAHPGLLALKGEIYHRELKQFNTARECFELAIYHDAQFVETYYGYLKLLSDTDATEAAEKLVARALAIKGIDRSKVLHLEALIYEKQGMHTMATASLNNALQYCQDKEMWSFYKDELKRVKKKNKTVKVKIDGEQKVLSEGLLG